MKQTVKDLSDVDFGKYYIIYKIDFLNNICFVEYINDTYKGFSSDVAFAKVYDPSKVFDFDSLNKRSKRFFKIEFSTKQELYEKVNNLKLLKEII